MFLFAEKLANARKGLEHASFVRFFFADKDDGMETVMVVRVLAAIEKSAGQINANAHGPFDVIVAVVLAVELPLNFFSGTGDNPMNAILVIVLGRFVTADAAVVLGVVVYVHRHC